MFILYILKSHSKMRKIKDEAKHFKLGIGILLETKRSYLKIWVLKNMCLTPLCFGPLSYVFQSTYVKTCLCCVICCPNHKISSQIISKQQENHYIFQWSSFNTN